jgi:hypothetical protein
MLLYPPFLGIALIGLVIGIRGDLFFPPLILVNVSARFRIAGALLGVPGA